MADSVTHHEHHHHHHHYHHHYQVPQQQSQGHRQWRARIQQGNVNQSQFRGPRPQQHFQTNVRSDGAGLDYWGNFGADWGYATGSGSGYYGGRQAWQGTQQGNPSPNQRQGQSQGQEMTLRQARQRDQFQQATRQAFGGRTTSTGYPFFGGYGQGYGNDGGNRGGTRGYAGFGHNY